MIKSCSSSKPLSAGTCHHHNFTDVTSKSVTLCANIGIQFGLGVVSDRRTGEGLRLYEFRINAGGLLRVCTLFFFYQCKVMVERGNEGMMTRKGEQAGSSVFLGGVFFGILAPQNAKKTPPRITDAYRAIFSRRFHSFSI